MIKKDVEIPPGDADNFKFARFTATIPPNPKAVVVMVPGSNADGRTGVGYPSWVRFQRDHNVALIGCHFEDRKISPLEEYINAACGSGQALLTALEKLDLDKLPIFLWGFSAGGEFNYEFVCWLAPYEPDRIKAFVVNKGGYYYTHVAPKEARAIPALFFIGTNDAEFRRDSIMGIYAANAVLGGCKWALDREGIGHMMGNSEDTAMRLFASELAKLPVSEDSTKARIDKILAEGRLKGPVTDTVDLAELR